jgi:osmotically-inducible protein OsmY
MTRRALFLPLLATTIALSACTPAGMVVGTGASLGVASMKEGGIRTAADDMRIKALINDLWFKYDLKTFAKLSTTVNQGRVLITGVVQDPEARVEAVRLAWQVDGVAQVINEIRVADSDGIPGYVRDQWIATRLRTAIMFDRDVQSLNYSIDTVQGAVYLMGVAQNQAELDHVIELARTIPHVREVVSYVKMAGQAIPSQTTTTTTTTVAPLAPTDTGYMPAAPVGTTRAAPVDAEALPPW